MLHQRENSNMLVSVYDIVWKSEISLAEQSETCWSFLLFIYLDVSCKASKPLHPKPKWANFFSVLMFFYVLVCIHFLQKHSFNVFARAVQLFWKHVQVITFQAWDSYRERRIIFSTTFLLNIQCTKGWLFHCFMITGAAQYEKKHLICYVAYSDIYVIAIFWCMFNYAKLDAKRGIKHGQNRTELNLPG